MVSLPTMRSWTARLSSCKFHTLDSYLGMPLVGNSIYDFIEKFAFFDKKEWKQNKGYIQAMEAVARHLNPESSEEEESEEASEEA